MAVKWFYQLFHDKIVCLLHSFPPNYVHEQTKLKFWSGLKKIPHPIHLDIEDELHFSFVASTSNILAGLAKINPVHSKK